MSTNPKFRLIQLINIAKSQLKLDEDLYRSMLKAATKKDSLRAMSLSELEQALECFKQKGFKPLAKKSAKKPAKGKRMSPSSNSAKPRNKEITKIRAIWITMSKQGIVRDGSETALDAYVRRMTSKLKGKGVDSVAWLTPMQSYPVLESLKNWHRREMLLRLVKSAAFITRDDNDKEAGYDLICQDYDDYLQQKL